MHVSMVGLQQPPPFPFPLLEYLNAFQHDTSPRLLKPLPTWAEGEPEDQARSDGVFYSKTRK